MNFDDVIGQKKIISALKHSIKYNKVGHAYIFTGPEGIGKKTLARIFCEQLLCEKQFKGEGCDECLSCRLTRENSNPDFRQLESAGSSISVDDIREIQNDIVIRPMYSPRKVYLIIDADNMTVQAQNCLLKTLEEPPEYAVIILTAARFDSLLETVRSRAVRCSFERNTRDEVLDFLKERFEREPGQLEFIASYSDGVVGTALELAGSDEFASLRNRISDTLIKLAQSKVGFVFETYGFFDENRNNISVVLDIMLLFYRDFLVTKLADKENILINSDKKDIILNNISLFSVDRLVKNIEIIELTRKNIKQNVNFQLAVEVMLMKLQEELH